MAAATVAAQSTADSLLGFIAANKSRSSIYLVKNDTVLAKLNENTMMPLASTVKIRIAIEFAKQAAAGIVNSNSYVALSDLDKFYIPNTDGNAHPQWLKYEKSIGHVKNDSIQLINVARGMIMFSSNANTEYLIDLLGFDNVKNNATSLGVRQHSAVFPIVSSLFIYQNPFSKKEEAVIKGIKSLSEEEYCKISVGILYHLKNDSGFKNKFRPQDLTMKMQKVWSDRLPASTTKEYVLICKILNNRRFFDKDTYDIIAKVLETVMENPANKTWLKHAGMKGGSTAWVLTKALYGTTVAGTKIEMAYFFNNLTMQENAKLQGWMNQFELETLSSDIFRQKISTMLK